MHPILAQGERIAVYLVGWVILGLLMAAMLASSGQVGFFDSVVFTLPLSLVYSFVCLSAWYVCRAFPLGSTPFPRLAFIHLLAASFASSFGVVISYGWHWGLQQSQLVVGLPVVDSRLLFGIGDALYLLAVAVHYLIVLFEDARSAEQRLFELKLLAQDAELRALRAQIDPHFLFNSLNSISALTTQDPSAARDMCIQLGDFLRKSLKVGAEERISLEEEIGLVKNFLAIEKVRFGKRLKVQISAEERSLASTIPPLLLQPLVENAIKHGIAQRIDGGTIELNSEQNGSTLRIKIRNPVDEDQKKVAGNRIGLQNVKERLSKLYGTDARIDTENSGGFFVVDLSIPSTVKNS